MAENELFLKHKALKTYQGHLKGHEVMVRVDYKEDAGVDEIILYMKFKNNKITDVMFEAKGKEEVFAAASLLCDLIKGKHYGDAQKITPHELAENLGFKKSKEWAGELAVRALYRAVEEKQKKEKGDPFENMAELLGEYTEGLPVGDPKFNYEHCGCGAGMED